MQTRVVTSLVLNCIALAVLLFSHNLPGSFLFLIVMDLIVAGGLYEFYSIVERKGSTSLMAFGMVVGVLYCTMAFFTSGNPICELPARYFDISLFIIIIGFFVFQFLRRDNSSVIYNFGGTIAGTFYVAWLLAFLFKINYFFGPENSRGMWYVLPLVAVVKGGDSMAYIVGHNFGKTRLWPKVSPKKTVEGAVAHLVTAVVIAVIFKFTLLTNLTAFQAVVVGVSMSVVGQFGDMAESLLKRDANVKDSAGHFPGVGGVLDLIDSVLLNMPLLYYFMLFWLV